MTFFLEFGCVGITPVNAIYTDKLRSLTYLIFLDTAAILALTGCTEAHNVEKKAAEKGVLFMGVTGKF